jgi:GDPmannose 4,6-dehydratase
MKKAFITGITGQDGSYLAEYLLGIGYEVHGLVRKVSHNGSTQNIDHIKSRLNLHTGSLASIDTIVSLFARIQPDEIYNLAAQSHVMTSVEMPVETADINYVGFLRILEAARLVCPLTKIYHASTSEIFGNSPAPQNENTQFHPTSTYSCAKIASYHQAIHHRESFGMYIAQGLLFNHESPRRPDTFVTRKITKAAARIKLGLQNNLELGNLDTARDWGFAGDFVKAIHAILQQEKPSEYVIGTGVCTTLRQFLGYAFRSLDLNWENYVIINPTFVRPQDHVELRADYSKAKKDFGWEPTVSIQQLVQMMIKNDLEIAERENR